MNSHDSEARILSLGIAGLVAAAALGGVALLSADDHSSGPAARSDAGGAAMSAVAYRSPACGCCGSCVEYLRRHDVDVQDEVTDEVDSIKADLGVPTGASSCHTSVIDGYAVEGHVPIEAIERLREERPDVDGIAVPGMPNSPGMGEPSGEPLEVVSIADGEIQPFMTVTY